MLPGVMGVKGGDGILLCMKKLFRHEQNKKKLSTCRSRPTGEKDRHLESLSKKKMFK